MLRRFLLQRRMYSFLRQCPPPKDPEFLMGIAIGFILGYYVSKHQ